MALETNDGPAWSIGQIVPLISGQAPPDYNPDRGPSGNDIGWCVQDPRYPYQKGGWFNPSGLLGSTAPNPLLIGMLSASALIGNDQVPSTLSISNIAGAQTVASGTAMTLVTTSGSGITLVGAVTILQTGNNVPSGTLCLDSQPAMLSFGITGAIGVPDPRTTLTRAVSVTSVSGASGGAVLINGFDLYGAAQTEIITAAAVSSTVNGKKTWKFIKSVTPKFTDGGSNYTVGTADIYGFPFRADTAGYVNANWASTTVTALTFVAADTTSPATSTTGDVRGTWVPPSASNGTRGANVQVSPSPQNMSTMSTTPGTFVGLFGVLPG